MGPVSTPCLASCCLKSSSARSVTSTSSVRGLSDFLVAFCRKSKKKKKTHIKRATAHNHNSIHTYVQHPESDFYNKILTYPSGPAPVGHHWSRQLFVAGEGVYRRALLVVLDGQILQIQLHIHFFLMLSAGKRHIVGCELVLQLIFRENRRIFQKFCHDSTLI